jgi:hypothetical protein
MRIDFPAGKVECEETGHLHRFAMARAVQLSILRAMGKKIDQAHCARVYGW